MIDFNDASPKIVPFGKYKGQPVEVLAQDKGYVEWMLAQDWFRERYASFHTLIVNNFSTDSETPEHNSLQVLFLDDAFCFSFLKYCEDKWLNSLKYNPIADALKELREKFPTVHKEIGEYVAKIRSKGQLVEWEQQKYNQAVKLEGDLTRLIVTMPEVLTYNVKFGRQFEVRGIDVVLDAWLTSNEKVPFRYRENESACISTDKRFKIEIKPSVGDDYPAILRQMRVNGSDYLFTQKYTGIGATKQQFIQTMKLSGIEVVFREDLG